MNYELIGLALNLAMTLVGIGKVISDMSWIKAMVMQHDKKIYNGMSTDIAVLMSHHNDANRRDKQHAEDAR